jgi:hypothetical protein
MLEASRQSPWDHPAASHGPCAGEQEYAHDM